MLRRATRGRLQEVPELTRRFMGATTPIAASPNPLKKLDLPDVNFYRRSAPFFSAPNCAHVRTIDLENLFCEGRCPGATRASRLAWPEVGVEFFSAPHCAHVRTIDLENLFLRRTVAGGDARLSAGMARSGR